MLDGSSGSTKRESGSDQGRLISSRRKFPDWISTTQVLGILLGLPALVLGVAMTRSTEDLKPMFIIWAVGFAGIIFLVGGIRRILYSMSRKCPYCGAGQGLKRGTMRESVEATEDERRAWLDEWRCGKCDHSEWVRVGIYRMRR